MVEIYKPIPNHESEFPISFWIYIPYSKRPLLLVGVAIVVAVLPIIMKGSCSHYSLSFHYWLDPNRVVRLISGNQIIKSQKSFITGYPFYLNVLHQVQLPTDWLTTYTPKYHFKMQMYYVIMCKKSQILVIKCPNLSLCCNQRALYNLTHKDTTLQVCNTR